MQMLNHSLKSPFSPEQKKRIQEAMASKPAPSEDNLELKGMKAMGAMEEGDYLGLVLK